MNEEYHRNEPGASGNSLSEKHRRILEEGSRIGQREIAESGAQTISRGRDLPHAFSERQRRRGPGILFTVHRPNGETSHIFRPDGVDPSRPGHKYEQPCKSRGAPGNTLDIPPSLHHLIEDTAVPVIFTEGTKKMLSVTTAARREGVTVLVVGVVGCWNWMADGEPIPDMFDIPVEGRSVTVMFDSDMLRKIEVQEAAKALANHLQRRGARVFVTYFHDAPDGSKVGADDFFVAGGTFAELRLLTRPYNPADFKLIRLSRDERLRLMLEDLWRTYTAMPAGKIGECSDRAAMREALRRAALDGSPSEAASAQAGILVRLPVRPMANKTRLGRQGQANSLRRLQRDGYIERVEEPKRKVEKKGALYLLKASTDALGRALSGHYGTGRQQHNVTQEQSEEREPHRNGELYAGVHSARASSEVPELRHSKVVHTWARQRGRRVVVDSEYVFRLGKSRQELLMYLLDNDGAATEDELLERFGSKSTRPRDFRRRRISPLLGHRYSRDKETGVERRAEIGPPLVSYVDGVVAILPEWREALEEYRRATDEDGDTRRQAVRYRQQSEAYRNRDRRPADEQPSPMLGKERVRRMTEADRRKARETRRQKMREYAKQSRPNEFLWREREAKRKAKANAPPEPPREMPTRVDGVYVHTGECECDWCAA